MIAAAIADESVLAKQKDNDGAAGRSWPIRGRSTWTTRLRRSGEAVVSDLLHHGDDPLAGDGAPTALMEPGVPAGGG